MLEYYASSVSLVLVCPLMDIMCKKHVFESFEPMWFFRRNNQTYVFFFEGNNFWPILHPYMHPIFNLHIISDIALYDAYILWPIFNSCVSLKTMSICGFQLSRGDFWSTTNVADVLSSHKVVMADIKRAVYTERR